ncbi:MAG: O-methyltransferase [Planctomycetota bacterium]
MSNESTLVTREHFEYVRSHTKAEDAFLGELSNAAREANIPSIAIAPEQASFLQILLKSAGAKRVVEVGTLAGYSAIAMARALPSAEAGGQLLTLEISEQHAAFAAEWIEKSDVADRVEVRLGPAAATLRELPANSRDAAFLDADKRGYPDYLRECLRIVRPGGLILVDNAFAFGELFAATPNDGEVGAVREFNELMAATPGLQSVIVPLGDGLWVGVVEPQGERV